MPKGCDVYSAAWDYVIANRGETVTFVYEGVTHAPVTFEGVLVSLGFAGSEAAGLGREYKDMMYRCGAVREPYP